MTVAALFVETGGAYFGIEGVDPWDVTRDARNYAGPHPVVAHPPCSTWCQMAKVNEARYGHKVGADGGCFASALASVREYGGVLKHPAYTHATRAHSLMVPRPSRGWQLAAELHVGFCGRAWVCQVAQSAYGHRARKRTWLYYVGSREPAPMDWREPAGTAWVGNDGTPGAKPMLSKREAKASPPAFRDALLALARCARPDAARAA